MAAAARRNIIKQVYENPRTGFGNQEQTLRQARAQDPTITSGEVRQFLDSLIVRQDRPERGYNSFVPPQPMFQLQVDLADMTAFAQGPVLHDAPPPKKVRRSSKSRSEKMQTPSLSVSHRDPTSTCW